MLRVTLLLISFIFIATIHGADPSLCDKYGSTQGIADITLVGSVVNGTLGTVANDSLKRYFNGSFPQGSTNYLADANAPLLNHLRDSLIQFFGAALGCADSTIAAYAGRNMSAAHAKIPIGIIQFNQFNNDVISVLKSAGVSDADRATVLGVLNSLLPQICNQPNCNPANYVDPSICDKYAIALNMTDYDLVDYVVGQVLANITTNPPMSSLLKYFNGQISGTTDFTTNSAALNVLRVHLTQFFGSALGCSASNYPAYQGKDLKTAHQNLPITQVDFDYFNVILLDVLSAAGVTNADRLAVSSVLNGTQSAVCTNCPTVTPTVAPTVAPTTVRPTGPTAGPTVRPTTPPTAGPTVPVTNGGDALFVVPSLFVAVLVGIVCLM